MADARPLWHAPMCWERVYQQDYGMHSYLYERWDHEAQLPSRLGNCTADSHTYKGNSYLSARCVRVVPWKTHNTRL